MIVEETLETRREHAKKKNSGVLEVRGKHARHYATVP